MSPYQRSIKGYQKVQVGTASPQKLLLMVYDGTLKFLKMAKMLIQKDQADRARVYVFKATLALLELISSLDCDNSPEISNALKSLYVYLLDKLKIVLQNNSIEDIDEITGILESLKEAWKEAFSSTGDEHINLSGQRIGGI
ncbi:MAG: flagellar export chaperone FliS [Candidatus Eremiobacteraeota bacterium]|nr:flagellar export chaperone FliS [Candidatus Eremiobacteraeota bacterium]